MSECTICYEPKKDFIHCPQCVHEVCLQCYRQLTRETCPFCNHLYHPEEKEEKGASFELARAMTRVIHPGWSDESVEENVSSWESRGWCDFESAWRMIRDESDRSLADIVRREDWARPIGREALIWEIMDRVQHRCQRGVTRIRFAPSVLLEFFPFTGHIIRTVHPEWSEEDVRQHVSRRVGYREVQTMGDWTLGRCVLDDEPTSTLQAIARSVVCGVRWDWNRCDIIRKIMVKLAEQVPPR
jgi:hypothetical protein